MLIVLVSCDALLAQPPVDGPPAPPATSHVFEITEHSGEGESGPEPVESEETIQISGTAQPGTLVLVDVFVAGANRGGGSVFADAVGEWQMQISAPPNGWTNSIVPLAGMFFATNIQMGAIQTDFVDGFDFVLEP